MNTGINAMPRDLLHKTVPSAGGPCRFLTRGGGGPRTAGDLEMTMHQATQKILQRGGV